MTRPPADLRCAYGAAYDVQCSNKAKWRTNIDLPVVECCWCDEHKDDDDMPLYPERATPPAEMLPPDTPDKMLYDLYVMAEFMKRGVTVAPYAERLEAIANYIRDAELFRLPQPAAGDAWEAEVKTFIKSLTTELYHMPTTRDEDARTAMDAADLLMHFIGHKPVEPSDRVAALLTAAVARPEREGEVERVARAICKSRTCEGFSCCQWPANGGRTKCPVRDGGYDDAARAALDAMRGGEQNG